MESDSAQQNFQKLFGWVDYLLFAIVLVLTALIGVFYAWRTAKRPQADYLTGGKKLGVFPIAMSLAAGYFHFIPTQFSFF